MIPTYILLPGKCTIQIWFKNYNNTDMQLKIAEFLSDIHDITMNMLNFVAYGMWQIYEKSPNSKQTYEVLNQNSMFFIRPGRWSEHILFKHQFFFFFFYGTMHHPSKFQANIWNP